MTRLWPWLTRSFNRCGGMVREVGGATTTIALWDVVPVVEWPVRWLQVHAHCEVVVVRQASRLVVTWS